MVCGSKFWFQSWQILLFVNDVGWLTCKFSFHLLWYYLRAGSARDENDNNYSESFNLSMFGVLQHTGKVYIEAKFDVLADNTLIGLSIIFGSNYVKVLFQIRTFWTHCVDYNLFFTNILHNFFFQLLEIHWLNLFKYFLCSEIPKVLTIKLFLNIIRSLFFIEQN